MQGSGPGTRRPCSSHLCSRANLGVIFQVIEVHESDVPTSQAQKLPSEFNSHESVCTRFFFQKHLQSTYCASEPVPGSVATSLISVRFPLHRGLLKERVAPAASSRLSIWHGTWHIVGAQ